MYLFFLNCKCAGSQGTAKVPKLMILQASQLNLQMQITFLGKPLGSWEDITLIKKVLSLYFMDRSPCCSCSQLLADLLAHCCLAACSINLSAHYLTTLLSFFLAHDTGLSQLFPQQQIDRKSSDSQVYWFFPPNVLLKIWEISDCNNAELAWHVAGCFCKMYSLVF